MGHGATRHHTLRLLGCSLDTSSHGAPRHQTPSPRDLHFLAQCAPSFPSKIPLFSSLCLANRPFLQNIFLALNILSSKELIEGSHPLSENIFRLALAESKKGYTFVPVFETERTRREGYEGAKRQAVFEARQ